MFNFSNKKRGGTLIELLLYTTLISTIMVSVTTFLIFILEGRVKNALIQEVYGQASLVTEIINQNIRNAESINTPSIGVNSKSLTLIVSGTTIIFDLNSDILQMTRGAGDPVNLTSDDLIISNLNFNNYSYDNSHGLIQTTFDVGGSSSSNRQEFNFDTSIQTSASLRKN